MNQKELEVLLKSLVQSTRENEWIEFKHNYHSNEEIGDTISALANSSALNHQPYGYLVFGIEDETHNIIGTSFQPKKHKIGNEEFENWLCQRLNPRIDLRILEFEIEGKQISLFQIPAAVNQPVTFSHKSFIRIGSYVRILGEFPDKERKIWSIHGRTQFEKEIALGNLSPSDVVNLIDTQCYFDLMHLPYPSTRDAVIEKFISEKLVFISNDSLFVSNLGGLLFAKDLSSFPSLKRKAVRVVVYKGKNKLDTLKDTIGGKGYAVGFQGLVSYIIDQIPQNEEISKALRKKVQMYPEESIRELVANALIHQDLSEKGSPLIEIYKDRIEFSNPGLPVITPIRFIDEYQSRNESLADLMRRLGMCEEKGSGIDRVIFQSEVFQLPAPEFMAWEKHTKVILYSHLLLNQMEKKDKVRACYQHSVLKYVSNEKMTNQSLRERFKIEERNSAIASRIIRDTIEDSLIKEDDPNSKSRKFAKYIPFWA